MFDPIHFVLESQLTPEKEENRFTCPANAMPGLWFSFAGPYEYLCRLYCGYGRQLGTSKRSESLHPTLITLKVDVFHFIDSRYNIVLLLFFVPYALSEIPSNVIIRRIGARLWLSFLITAWGVSVLGMGFVRHWVPLVLLRILLGLFEGGCTSNLRSLSTICSMHLTF